MRSAKFSRRTRQYDQWGKWTGAEECLAKKSGYVFAWFSIFLIGFYTNFSLVFFLLSHHRKVSDQMARET